MSDMDLQRVTESLSYIRQASNFMTLTRKEEAFCVAVLGGRNLSDAYRAAYKPKRAKVKTIHEMASRLMAKRKVRARLTELLQPVIGRALLSHEEWLEALVRIIRADVRNMFDTHGTPLPITFLGPNEAAAIAAFEVRGTMAASSDVPDARGGMVRIRIVDKLKALELYGKAIGYFAEQQKFNNCSPHSITVKFVSAVPLAHRRIGTGTAVPASSSARHPD
jgi:hypothetical protein